MVKCSTLLTVVACAVMASSSFATAASTSTNPTFRVVATGSGSTYSSAGGSGGSDPTVGATSAPAVTQPVATAPLSSASASGSTVGYTSAPATTQPVTTTPAQTTAAPSTAPTTVPVSAPTTTTTTTTTAPVPVSAPTTGPTTAPAPASAPTTAPSATSVGSTPTSTPTTKAPVTGSTISGQVKLVPGYYNCGGVGFDYSVYMDEPAPSDATRLACQPGYRCQDVAGQYVFTCNVWPNPDPVDFYGQCGGKYYDGQTFCAPGAVCKYVSESFSQCLPTY